MLGNIEVSLGDYASGRHCFVRSLVLSVDLEFVWGIAFSLEGLARLAVEQQQHERALVLAGAAEVRRRILAIPPPAVGRADLERALTRAREALPEADARRAFARGQGFDDQTLIGWLRTEQLLPTVQ